MYRVECPPGGITHSKEELLRRPNGVVLSLTLRNDTEVRHLLVQDMTFRGDPSRETVVQITDSRACETNPDGQPLNDVTYDVLGWLNLEVTQHGTVLGEVRVHPIRHRKDRA